MIYITPEGAELRNGINFYPWKDRHTSGVAIKLRIGNKLWAVRYSPKLKRIVRWYSELGVRIYD